MDDRQVGINRRSFLLASCLGGFYATQAQARANARIRSIQRSIIWNGRNQEITWFHPRACVIPQQPTPVVLMTCQSITGSDVFGPVHVSTTRDLGQTWTTPQPIAAFGRHDIEGGLQMGVCDVVPEFHSQTGKVLAIGHNVYYKDGKLTQPNEKRYPCYAVFDPQQNTWSDRKRIAWDDPRATAIYTCGCGQRLVLPNGDLLIPFSFAPLGQTDRTVGTVRCTFDGQTITMIESGPELRLPIQRGLLEPSIAQFQGQYWLTIRAEDERGYSSVSEDGLHWQPIRPWSWDDGEPLSMSTTQQHWISQDSGLFLVYTRKTDQNAKVFRWRAPLYIAQVDPQSARLIRSSEQTVFPLIGDGIDNPKHVARMGNFHTTNITPSESWVTVGETLPDDGWKGDTLLAKIKWDTE